MDLRFRAFTFVNRITAVDPGRSITGTYQLPAGAREFPRSLAAEAVGQLAAWSAMARVDFRSRPVAGIASRVELLREVRPGETLELAATLDSVDEEAVSYNGAALVQGVPVVRLHHCVGPMVPVAEYDDPVAVRAKYEQLCAAPATDDRFAGLPDMNLAVETAEPGRSLRASFVVPAHSAYFEDHFPRRPVFPGSLLMHLNLQLAHQLATTVDAAGTNGHWRLTAVNDVKLRAFIAPGTPLSLEATLRRANGELLEIAVQTRSDSRPIGGARVELQHAAAP